VTLAGLEAVRRDLDATRETIEEMTDKGVSLKHELDSMREAHLERMLIYTNDLGEAKAKIRDGIDKALQHARTDIDKLKSQRAGLKERRDQLRTEIATLERQVAERQTAKKRREELTAEKSRINDELTRWTYLRTVCGKDGLRALEIDSVAPVVSGYANDLLVQTFGPSWTIRFQTQDPETGREVLDILVIREDGQEVLLDNLSGGEKVWILKALRLAMTLVSKEKSARAFETGFADEEDGALDAMRAQSFIGMYRAFMAAGGFDTFFYITHRPECKELADYRMVFNGGVTIE